MYMRNTSGIAAPMRACSRPSAGRRSFAWPAWRRASVHLHGKGFFNPGGLVNDRIGLQMIESHEREARSTGERLSRHGGQHRHRPRDRGCQGLSVLFTMPDKRSHEKCDSFVHSVHVVITPTAVGRSSRAMSRKPSELHGTPGGVLAVSSRPRNPEAHSTTTVRSSGSRLMPSPLLRQREPGGKSGSVATQSNNRHQDHRCVRWDPCSRKLAH